MGVVAGSMAMRVGLREVINNLPGLAVVQAATQADELPEDGLDVLVVVLPASLDKSTCARAVLYLTDTPADLQDVLGKGELTWGALPVNASENELQFAIQALAEGLWVGSPTLLSKILARRPAQDLDETEDNLAQPLTAREVEVLQLAAQGLANKQIAAHLGISEHTIKFHLSTLYAKLGVASRTEAVRAGARRGLVVL
ncbi:MAG TPA: response regulator transcription factor [Anaerolineales bacterium]